MCAPHLRPPLAAILLAMLLAIVAPAPIQAQDATFLHALVIADTKDALIGPDVRIDGNNVYNRLFQEVPRHRSRITVLSGERVTKQHIADYYRRLTVRATDAVFCFFAGHGAMDEGEHFLAMTDGEKLKRKDLLAMMKGKGGRLHVLITDSCAKVETESRAPVYAMVKPARVELARYLFFRHTGVVDINSASPPQLAFGDDKYGGVFTSAFQELLVRPNSGFDRNNDGIVSWDEFFASVSQTTEMNFRLLKQRNPGLDQKTQTPKAWSLAKPVADALIRYETLRIGINVSNTDGKSGVRIDKVYPGSPAEWYGLRAGDVVYEVDWMNYASTQQVFETWKTPTVDTISKPVLGLSEPSLLRCKVYDSTTKERRTVYVRTLGLPPR